MVFRRLTRIFWTERKTNAEVLQLAGMERSLVKTIGERQLKFLGHIRRKMDWKRSCSVEKLKEKEAAIEKEKHSDSLNALATKKQMPNNSFIKLADDRVEWRTMIVVAYTRPYIRRRLPIFCTKELNPLKSVYYI
ncbi:lysosome-associated membrane glycoprotein 5 [Plakobranchus ocellatus]|uniref:Lysosome-associated membrane glycoprotein 5 n=1 Tax=Plakobranchus ocellatus TaxID=259542 RepID=A0AAV3YIN6_9GAST|nr:lysosome-associated membrane glycoprotein 5 [Plakobranchus ocellatus]